MKNVNEYGTKTFTVKVHQRDINKGIRLSHHECPIAIAAKRTLSCKGNKKSVTVDGNSLFIGYFRYSLPKAARMFVTKFDKTHKVKPFEFSAELVNDMDEYYKKWNEAHKV